MRRFDRCAPSARHLIAAAAVCSAAQFAIAVGLVIDNFESGPVLQGAGTHVQSGLPTSDCLAGSREVTVYEGNFVALLTTNWNNHDDYITFTEALPVDFICYDYASVDFTGGGVYDRLHVNVNGMTVTDGTGGFIEIIAQSANGGLGFGGINLWGQLGWHTRKFYEFADVGLDWTQITSLTIGFHHDTSIAEIKTGLNGFLKIKFRSALSLSIVNVLGLSVDLAAAIELAPHWSEATDTTEIALLSAEDANGDTLDGTIEFTDSGDASNFGYAAGFTLWETNIGAGDTRAVEFEWVYPASAAHDLQLLPLSTPIQEQPKIAHAPVSVELSDAGAVFAHNDLMFRMEVPTTQPWQIDGVDLTAHPSEVGVRGLILMSKDPSESPVAGEALLQVSLTADQNRISLVPAPIARSSISMRPVPSIMGSTTQIQLSRPIPVAASIDILDARGRQMLSLGLPAGSDRVVWNGRDANGTDLASGVYFLRLHSAGTYATTKLVKLR